MRDLPNSTKFDLLPIMDNPRGSCVAKLPTHVDIFPDYRVVGFAFHAIETVFIFEDSGPDVVVVLVESLGYASKHGNVSNGSFLEDQTPIFFCIGQGFLVEEVHFLFMWFPKKNSFELYQSTYGFWWKSK